MHILTYKYANICIISYSNIWIFWGLNVKRECLRLNKTTNQVIQRYTCKPQSSLVLNYMKAESSLVLNYPYARKRVFLSPEKGLYIQTMECEKHELATNREQIRRTGNKQGIPITSLTSEWNIVLLTYWKQRGKNVICISIRLMALRGSGNAEGEGWQGTDLRVCEVLAR
jgi:hypothetical protein